MNIIIKGKPGLINLTKRDFVASGGEGSVYVKKRIAFKIYNDPKKMISLQKMRELSALTDPNIINPKELVLDRKKRPIGYTMKYLSDTYVLCQIFTKAFRDRNGLTNEMALKLVRRLQQEVCHIHSKQILVVDLNEMNFLVNKALTEIYAIDVDSYQTKSFPATAIMESIKDVHTKTFDENTDWFSFGIVSFQMFAGIHPYKGKHSKIKGLTNRMMANIPVFHKDVSYPRTCQPFDIIPETYRNWYKAIFYKGERVSPPLQAQAVITIITDYQKIKSNTDFDIIKLTKCLGNILEVISSDIILTTEYIYVKDEKYGDFDRDCHVITTPVMDKLIKARIVDGKLILFALDSKSNIGEYNISAENIMSYDNRLFIKNGETFSELNFLESTNNLNVFIQNVGNIMPFATRIFDGVIIQDMLGVPVTSIFPEPNTSYQFTLEELKGYKIIDAKYDNKILMVIGNKGSKYDKFIFKIKDDFTSYSTRKVEDISYYGINFVVLQNGIVIHINHLEEMEIFSNKDDSAKIKVIDNNSVTGNMKLFKDGTKALFSTGDTLYRIKMKN